MVGTYWKSLFSVIKPVCFSEDRKLYTIKTLQFIHTVNPSQGVPGSICWCCVVWWHAQGKVCPVCVQDQGQQWGHMIWHGRVPPKAACFLGSCLQMNFSSLCIQKHFTVASVLVTSIFPVESVSQFEKLGMNATKSNLENTKALHDLIANCFYPNTFISDAGKVGGVI